MERERSTCLVRLVVSGAQRWDLIKLTKYNLYKYKKSDNKI